MVKGQTGLTTSDKIDRIVTNRFLALPIFAAVMFLVYYIAIDSLGTIVTDFTNDTLFGEWIQGYSSEEYVQANGALIEQMNRLAEGLSPAQTDRLTEIFVRCSRYELAFWDMAWEMRA